MAAKAKISITLSTDLLERIDGEVEAHAGENRSRVIERWLRRASQGAATSALREETIRYYEAMSERERAEDEAIARAASKRARRAR